MALLRLALPRRWLAAPAELETAVLKFTILRDGKLGRVAIPDVHGVALLYLRQGTHQARVGRVQEHDPLLLQRHPTASELPHARRPRWERPGSGQRQLGQRSLARWAVCLFLFSGCHGLLCGRSGPLGLFVRRIRVTAGNRSGYGGSTQPGRVLPQGSGRGSVLITMVANFHITF